MQPPVLSSSMPTGTQQQQQGESPRPYSDAGVASTLSLPPFSEFCKLRDDWAAKPLIRGHYRGLCGGDPAQRERREDFESISLIATGSSVFSGSSESRGRSTLPGQVEAYSRSAAGKIIDPHHQRTPLALEKTMHFLVEHYLRVPHTPLVFTDPFRIWGYLWDRFRGIRTTWGPQLPPSNVSIRGYVDSESGLTLPVDSLRRESCRRVRWLEFTAAALAVGGAYLCLTPKGCMRFMQDKKQFLESMSQCFTDLTVFYRAEQRHCNAEFFSVLILLYGLNQEMKVEDRATFCRFHTIQVDGQLRLCPEPPAECVNLAQVNRELEKQPYMTETQPVRTALALIDCWATRRWFAFFELCKSRTLTPLQRAVVFQSFTYARYRAVLDLVLPNYYVYPKLRVRHPVAVAELADQLMMDPTHCLHFLKAMGLESQLELMPPVDRAGAPAGGWHLKLCHGTSDPLVTAEELEDKCQNKRVLFLPTYPEFFGFRVWHEAYDRFPNAAGLARPGTGPSTSGFTTAGGSSSPMGRGAVSLNASSAAHGSSKPSSMRKAASTSAQYRGAEWGRSGHDAENADADEGDSGGDYGAAEDGSLCSDACGRDSDAEGEAQGDYADDEYGMEEEGSHNSESEGDDREPPSPASATPPFSPTTAAAGSIDAELLRQPGCPVNLMEILEAYCPPYHDEVAALTLVDASQELFASLREHRAAMLRRCKSVRRSAPYWQKALKNYEARNGDAFSEASLDEALSEGEAEWIEKMMRESVSTSSSVFYSDDDANDDGAHQRLGASSHALALNHHSGEDSLPRVEAQQLGISVPSAIAEARQLVRALRENVLYTEAAADQAKRHAAEVGVERSPQLERQAAAAATAENATSVLVPDSPLPHITPTLALTEAGPCSVVPLPDDYGDAEGGRGEGSRCNSQTTRVIVESPVSLPSAGGAPNFLTADAQEGEEGRQSSAELTEPHPPASSSDNASAASMSKLFPCKPSQQTLTFGTARPAMPPLQFNTAIPKAAVNTASTAFAPTQAAAAAAPAATQAGTTTPKANQRALREGSGDSGSSSSSSAPMLEYSHLKRRAGAKKDRDDDDGDAEGAEAAEYDFEGGDEETESRESYGEGDRTLSSSSSESADPSSEDVEVDLPSHNAAVTIGGKEISTQLPRRPLHPPPPMAAIADSFTPRHGKASRRTRRGDRDAADGSSSSHESDDPMESHGNFTLATCGTSPKRHKADVVLYGSEQRSPPLPLAEHEVNAFAEVCVPLISEYLQLWTQLTHADQTALEAAAQCLLDARAAERGSAFRLRSLGGPLEEQWQHGKRQALARRLARRARELLTVAVLRGSMSEYGQHTWDAAVNATIDRIAASADSTLALTLGSLWAVPYNGLDAPLRGQRGPHRRPQMSHPDDADTSLFSSGCSAALIPLHEVQAMLAIENGAVPVLSGASSEPFHSRVISKSSPSSQVAQRRLSVPSNAPLGCDLSAFTTAFAAAFSCSDSRSQRRPLRASYAGDRSDAATASVEADGLMKMVKAAADAALHNATGFLAPNLMAQSQVVFDRSIQKYVAWEPPSSAHPTSSFSRGRRVAAASPQDRNLETAVLQLTSAYVFVSTKHAEPGHHPTPRSPSHVTDADEAKSALAALFCRGTERWLAELLLPSSRPGGSTPAATPVERQTDFRNDRILWLSAPADSERRTPLVARLYQADQFIHVPVSTRETAVPLATRIALYGCEGAALRRLRVRRDGGVKFVPVDGDAASNVPPSTTTALAMSHAHYTAIVAVDLADAQAMVDVRSTLALIVDSHVPRTVMKNGTAVSSNSVAGVLLCAVSSTEAGTADDSRSTAMMEQLEDFFWEQWQSKHGTSATRCNLSNRRSSVGQLQGKLHTASLPAVVSVRIAYGDAERATAAVAHGMQTILASYAQQAVSVLGDA
ncbi:hypothetical protein ABL78_3395 [Leptomonas seymouri]|uniref:SAC3/GANP/THP3 conserved domain-containing protein n=1 Tax=Leptomonas seymouri TaxID=5684 RepID=A0A0N0P6S7_LEPSE|nr:hypothetical protein ABL78_3395 [Leptomonas seymouri]|eukprot:KPI87517.1 hypothetical protein ABL78_3395 [Leptomonas seymouri]